MYNTFFLKKKYAIIINVKTRLYCYTVLRCSFFLIELQLLIIFMDKLTLMILFSMNQWFVWFV